VSVFVIILRRGMKFSSTSASPGMEMPPEKAAIIQDEGTGTRSHFVSSIPLRNDIAVVAEIASSAVHVAII
jgi:hypothetical protein